MLRSLGQHRADLADLERLESWTRSRFSLGSGDIVLVSENPTMLPGAPPFETEISFWTDPESPHRFKIFKQAAEVNETDLPVGWLKSALRDYGDGDCC